MPYPLPAVRGKNSANSAGEFWQGLIGYWKMDESIWSGVANEVVDSSGQGNHGTAKGVTGTSTGSNSGTTLNDTGQSWTTNAWANHTITITSGTGSGQIRTISSNTGTQVTVSVAWGVTPDNTSHYRITPSTAAGQFGNAGNFNGYKDSVQLASVTPFQIATKTIAFWANPGASIGATQPIFSGETSNFYVGVAISNTLLASWANGSGTQKTLITVTTPAVPGQWHHFTCVFSVSGNNVTVTWYADGIQAITTTVTDGYSAVYGTSFILGGFAPTSLNFYGLLDELRFYNRALSAQEVALLAAYHP